MTLPPGTRIGTYEVVGLLGAGGMGEVYRARDTTLNREVALKVLPDSLAGDPDRLARFRREAQVLASLNHPNIAHIHGFEQSVAGQAATFAIVMELVEGPTLADRIAEGPIDQGIVHRDLKPANIKVRDDGTVKVLDFGLAKALDPTDPSSAASISGEITGHRRDLDVVVTRPPVAGRHSCRRAGICAEPPGRGQWLTVIPLRAESIAH